MRVPSSMDDAGPGIGSGGAVLDRDALKAMSKPVLHRIWSVGPREEEAHGKQVCMDTGHG